MLPSRHHFDSCMVQVVNGRKYETRLGDSLLLGTLLVSLYIIIIIKTRRFEKCDIIFKVIE